MSGDLICQKCKQPIYMTDFGVRCACPESHKNYADNFPVIGDRMTPLEMLEEMAKSIHVVKLWASKTLCYCALQNERGYYIHVEETNISLEVAIRACYAAWKAGKE